MLASTIGGIILLVLILCVPVTIMLVKFQLKNRKQRTSRYHNTWDLYDNAMYIKGKETVEKLNYVIRFYFLFYR